MKKYARLWKKLQQNLVILVVLVFLFLLFAILNNNFVDRYNLLSMTQSLVPYAILALGVTFVIASGGIDLSIGTVCMGSAAIAGRLYMLGMPLGFVIPIMILIGAAIGLLNGLLVAKLKVPAFIATLGTMMAIRGLSAIIVSIPNIIFPTGTWYNRVFSSAGGFPIGIVWIALLAIVCAFIMYKTKVGRYILSIGSNEEATRLSGVDTVKYKMIAYVISGTMAGIAAIFWTASFATIVAAGGSGMELDAIAGVYVGGTAAAGGSASILGSLIGSMLLVVIRSGLNFLLAKWNISLNSTYVTYVLTGTIVVAALLFDTLKNKRASKILPESPKNKKRNIIFASSAGGLLLAGIVAISVISGFAGTQKKTIAVVAKGETHAFWLSVKSGVKDACEKHGYEFTFRGPPTESPENLPKEMEMIQSAISNKASAIVISSIGEGLTDLLTQAYEQKIPVVSFDSGVWEKDVEALDQAGTNPIVAKVNNDNYAAAELAAEHLFAEIKDDIAASGSTYVIGAIQFDLTTSAQDRVQGFLDKFEKLADADSSTKGKYKLELESKADESNNAYQDALNALVVKGAKAVYMSSEPVVAQSYDAIKAVSGKYDDITFVGFDAGDKQIEWMRSDDNPVLIGSVAQNSYMIGYHAAEQAINAVEGKAVTTPIYTDGIWWDKSNMDELIESNIVYKG